MSAACNAPTIRPGEKPHIEVRDLTMAFGDFVLQRELTFAIPRNSIFVIMGGSGCGKSTLLRHIPGVAVAEMPRHRENGYCCGAGGLIRMDGYVDADGVARWRAGDNPVPDALLGDGAFRPDACLGLGPGGRLVGIVDQPEDYEWSSARSWKTGEPSVIPVCRGRLVPS